MNETCTYINYLAKVSALAMMDSQLHCLDGFLLSLDNLKHEEQRIADEFQ